MNHYHYQLRRHDNDYCNDNHQHRHFCTTMHHHYESHHLYYRCRAGTRLSSAYLIASHLARVAKTGDF
jgi:hypothetical protein